MAVRLSDMTRRLGELIMALDRRAPHVDRPGEAAIARDAAALREEAVARLAEIADVANPAPDVPPDRVD
jgi:hypothetical protein